MSLSDMKLRKLKPRDRAYKVSDGEGLYVEVSPKGSILWRMAYRYQRRQKTLYIGPYPKIGLREARSLRDEAKATLAQGIDPSGPRAQEAGHTTVRELCEAWVRSERPGWGDKYARKMEAALANDVYPTLGHLDATEVSPRDILAAIRRIESRGSIDTGRRVRQTLGRVFRYGVAIGRCERDPSADIKDALQKAPAVRHRSALWERDMPQFMQRLAAYDGPVTRMAIDFTIRTMVRTNETRFALWDEIEDLGGTDPLWRIPAERMKMRRDHLVPLSRQVVDILTRMQPHRRGTFIFPSTSRSGALSENTMIYAMYRMGYHGRATIHGFRRTASTILNESEFNPDWIEMQLAHVDGGVRGIYNAAQHLAGRRQMLQWWSDKLDELKNIQQKVDNTQRGK